MRCFEVAGSFRRLTCSPSFDANLDSDLFPLFPFPMRLSPAPISCFSGRTGRHRVSATPSLSFPRGWAKKESGGLGRS